MIITQNRLLTVNFREHEMTVTLHREHSLHIKDKVLLVMFSMMLRCATTCIGFLGGWGTFQDQEWWSPTTTISLVVTCTCARSLCASHKSHEGNKSRRNWRFKDDMRVFLEVNLKRKENERWKWLGIGTYTCWACQKSEIVWIETQFVRKDVHVNWDLDCPPYIHMYIHVNFTCTSTVLKIRKKKAQ